MNRTLKIIFASLIALVLLVTIIGAVMMSFGVRKVSTTGTNASNANRNLPPSEQGVGANVTIANVPQTVANTQTPSGEEAAKELAILFAERFGSFSNQTDYENVASLKGFMTSRMQEWADGYVAQGRASTDPGAPYYGITTSAIAAEQQSFDDAAGKAEYLVSAARREVNSAKATDTTFNQQLRVRLARSDNAWKVDEAVWLTKE